jgi:uncharacterized protein (DUF2141 family)
VLDLNSRAQGRGFRSIRQMASESWTTQETSWRAGLAQLINNPKREQVARETAANLQSKGIAPSKEEPTMPKRQWGRMTRGILGAILPAVLLANPALAAELRITIQGVRSDAGEILIGLYDNADGFKNAIANAAKRGLLPDSSRLIGTAIRAKRGVVSTVFTQLPKGRYAIIVIHDENDNGRLDENSFGVPTEGYGFGNDAQGLLSAPSFDAAAVTVADADISASIKLI